MQLTTLASGSSGNSLLLSHNGEHILIDAGISTRRIANALRSLGVDPAAVLAVLVTHDHTDHITGLPTLTKQFAIPTYTSPGTAAGILRRSSAFCGDLHTVMPGESFTLGPFSIETFPTSHDARGSMGFAVTADGRKAAVVTDLGYVTDEVLDAVLGCHLLVCEANHDVEWLRSGPYPAHLIQRILSDTGHLSNEAAAALCVQCVERGTHTVILAHLSAENNTPHRALQVLHTALQAAGLEASVLTVAPRKDVSPTYEV